MRPWAWVRAWAWAVCRRLASKGKSKGRSNCQSNAQPSTSRRVTYACDEIYEHIVSARA